MSTDEGLGAEYCVWGLVPFFSKQAHFSPLLINARAETAAIKPTFKQAFMQRRGFIIMNGYFEWRLESTGKQPYYIHWPDHRLLMVAALWDSWMGGDGTLLYSCCLLTRPATQSLQALHNRMPVILNHEVQATWLSSLPLNHAQSSEVLLSYAFDELQTTLVTPKMNNWRFERLKQYEGRFNNLLIITSNVREKLLSIACGLL